MTPRPPLLPPPVASWEEHPPQVALTHPTAPPLPALRLPFMRTSTPSSLALSTEHSTQAAHSKAQDTRSHTITKHPRPLTARTSTPNPEPISRPVRARAPAST
eukprot:scaffold6117_cov118-Isochrysis_galbana.AAC.1